MIRKWTDCADLPLKPRMDTINWTPYSLGNKIAFYDSNDAVIALVDPETAEIVIQEAFKDSYEINVWVNDAAVINVCNKKTNETAFNLSLPTEELLNIEVGKAYTLVNLTGDWNMWMYNGWKAVNKDGINVLLVSPTGHLYSNLSLQWTYKYDRGLQAVELTLYHPLDAKSKKNPIKVRLKVQPMNM